MGPMPVPTVSKRLASAATLCTFIDIPASHPSYMGSEPCVTGAGETSHIICTGCIKATVGSSIEERVIYVTFIQLIAGWKLHVSVTVMSIKTILIIFTTNYIISTSVVVLVTNPIATIVVGTESKPS